MFKDKKFANCLWLENQFVKYEYAPFTGWKNIRYTGKYIKTNDQGEKNNLNLKITARY